MTTTTRQETAKVYLFPRQPRLSAAGQRREVSAGVHPNLYPLQEVEFGSGWYHEAAVQDLDRTRKP